MKGSSKLSKTILLSLALVLVACGTSSPSNQKAGPSKSSRRSAKTAQSIAINIVSEPQTLDPRRVRSLNCINLVRMLNEGLTRLGKQGVTELALADKFAISDDMKTYTFKIKESYWSNGDKVTADDFLYAWKKSLSPEFPSDNAFLLFPVKNAKKVKTGELPSSFLGLSTPSEDTLIVELEHPVPYFLELLSLPIYFPVNQKHEKSCPNWNYEAETFICNGPFKLERWNHTSELLAVKNDHYWDAKNVKLDSIKMCMVDVDTGFKMFEGKELHWDGSPFSTIPVDAISHLAKNGRVESDPLLGTYWIRTNVDAFPCQSDNLRKALARAIDRGSIVEHVTQGYQTPATGIVPVSMGLQDTPYFQDADAAEAANLLKAALADSDMRLEDFPTLTLTYVADSRNHRIAQAVQDQWQKNLGLHVKLEPLESKVYFDRISKKDYQLACGSWIADFNDPINFLEIFKSKTIGTNNTNWESPDYTKALEASYLSANSEERRKHLQESEKMLMDAMPVIPIYHYTMLHMKSHDLKDVVLSDSGHIDFKWAYLDPSADKSA